MTDKFRYLPLAVILSATPVLAQEDNEHEIRIELESGGSPAVGITTGVFNEFARVAVGFSDKSVWFRSFDQNDGFATYCWVDDENQPQCKLVEIEDK